jgi:hypothetical protein
MCRELHERFMPDCLDPRNKIKRSSITFLLGVIHTFYPQVSQPSFHSGTSADPAMVENVDKTCSFSTKHAVQLACAHELRPKLYALIDTLNP